MQCLFSPTSKAQSFKKIFLKKKKKLHALYLRKSQVILQQSTKCVLNREKDGPNPTSTSSNIQNNPSHKRQMHHQASILPNLKIWSKIKHIIELLTRVSKWKGESKPAQIKNTNPPPPPPKKGAGTQILLPKYIWRTKTMKMDLLQFCISSHQNLQAPFASHYQKQKNIH